MLIGNITNFNHEDQLEIAILQIFHWFPPFVTSIRVMNSPKKGVKYQNYKNHDFYEIETTKFDSFLR